MVPPYTTSLGFLDNLKEDLSYAVRKGVFAAFMRACKPSPASLAADFGVTAMRSHPTHAFFERLYPYPGRLTAIGREESLWMQEEFPGVTFLKADLRSIPVPDLHFDVGICNAVVEHAGDHASQRHLVQEVCRTCRQVLFTTPNRWFPVELHTFLPLVHWLPKPAFRNILRTLGYGALSREENLNPLGAREFMALFPEDRENSLLDVSRLGLRTNLACLSAAPDRSRR